MNVVLLNDTRADPNPGCQATVSTLVRHLSTTLDAVVNTRPRGEGYEYFEALVTGGRAHCASAWYHAVSRLERESPMTAALGTADLVVVNLEGTFHHHTVGALALGGALAVAHRLGARVWAVNGTVEAIEPWLLAATLMPAEHVAVREPWSGRWLAARGVSTTPAADAVFLAEVFTARGAAEPLSTRAVFYTPGVRLGTMPSHEAAVAEVLADLSVLVTAGWEPVFVQLEDREAPLTDAVSGRGFATADGREVAWSAFGAYLQRFALVVSGRYHVLIFAAMAGVPAIARPSNTHKIEGLLALLGRSHALARDAAALADVLASELPRPVGQHAIRACQSLALGNVGPGPPPPGAAGLCVTAHGAAVIEGLDWAPPAMLPHVLAELRRTGPDQFQTSVATTPGDLRRDGLAVVRSALAWREHFATAGFAVASEREVPTAQATVTGSPADEHWTRLNPFRDSAAGQRRVFLLRSVARATVAPVASGSAANRPLASVLRAHDSHVRFLVGTYADFDDQRSLWLALPAHARSVVIRTDVRDQAWRLVQSGIEAWCRSHGITVACAGEPGDLDWQVRRGQSLLVVSHAPVPSFQRTFQGAFMLAARRRGWRALVTAPDSTAACGLGADGAPSLSALLGEWTDRYGTRILVVGAEHRDLAVAARRRPDVLFIARPDPGDPSTCLHPPLDIDNLVVLDDAVCLLGDLTTRALFTAVDAVVWGATGRSIARTVSRAGHPRVALDGLDLGVALHGSAVSTDSADAASHSTPDSALAHSLDRLAVTLTACSAPTATTTPGDPEPMRIALFGASSGGRAVAARVRSIPGVTLAYVFDNNRSIWDTSVDGVRVVCPDSERLSEVDAVLVSSVHADAIGRQMTHAGHGHKLVFDAESLERCLRL